MTTLLINNASTTPSGDDPRPPIFDDGPNTAVQEPTSQRSAALRCDSQPRRDVVTLQGQPRLRMVVERRKLPRRAMDNVGAMAVVADEHGAGLIARVQIKDMSWQGAGLDSPVPMVVGSSVRLTPEHAMIPRQQGVVVRCVRTGDAYDVGVRCAVSTQAVG